MESIIQKDTTTCYYCGVYGNLEKHHIFNGSNRDHSEADGLTVYLCQPCHTTRKKTATQDGAVHLDAAVANKLKAEAQEIAMQYHGYTMAQWMARYHKSYLDYIEPVSREDFTGTWQKLKKLKIKSEDIHRIKAQVRPCEECVKAFGGSGHSACRSCAMIRFANLLNGKADCFIRGKRK